MYTFSGLIVWHVGFSHSSVGKASACNEGDLGSIPGSVSSPGAGNGNPLKYSCLENPMDRGAWQATVHGITRVGHNLALSFLTLFKKKKTRRDPIFPICLLLTKLFPPSLFRLMQKLSENGADKSPLSCWLIIFQR